MKPDKLVENESRAELTAIQHHQIRYLIHDFLIV